MDKGNQKTSKVVSTGDEAAKKARGERLKKLRNLANMSREELCNTPDLNVNTFKGWELGRFYGLNKDGAERVIARVAQKNVYCTVEWLMDGIGEEPIVLLSNPAIKIADARIQKELSIFHSLFKQVLYAEINDTLTGSLYQFGDVVAGTTLPLESSVALMGQVCLVETIKHEVLVVRLLKNLGSNKFLVARLADNEQIEATIINIARITRLYRP